MTVAKNIHLDQLLNCFWDGIIITVYYAGE